MSHILSLIIGDESDDGHGKRDTYVIESNLSREEIQAAYTRALSEFDAGCLTTVAEDYEDCSLSATQLFAMRRIGYRVQNMYWWQEFKEDWGRGQTPFITADEFVDLFLTIVRAGDSNFVYKRLSSADTELFIGGYGLFA